MSRIAASILSLLVLVSACQSQEPAGNAPVFANDRDVRARLLKDAERLLNERKTFAAKNLTAKIPANKVPIPFIQPVEAALPPAQVFQNVKPGVLIVGGLYKCEKCTNWHVNAASGFVISASGVAVTAYHVFNAPEKKAMVAMTSDGRVMPVTAVLAASEVDDVAVIKLDGDGLTALPLRADAPIGTKVLAVHHPDEQYYTLTEGLISRYCMRHSKEHRQATCMVITAEFAKGSSGAPIFDDRGNVIGLVCSTRTIYYSEERKDPQMVIRECAPAASVLKLLEPGK